MPKFEDNILGFVPKKDWLDVGTEAMITRPNDPADQLFGDQRTDNITAEWESINSMYNNPVMAQFHGWDTEAQTTFRVPVDRHNIEKGLIKVKINQSERMRALLRSGVQNDKLYEFVIRDGVNLAEQVATRTKVAKNELLATGKVTIKENNLDLTVDYGVDNAQTAFTLDLSPSADVISQIETIINAAKAKGVILNGFMTRSENITKMKRNTAFQKIILGNAGAGQQLRNSQLNDFLGEEFKLTKIITNDYTYGVPGGFDANGRPIVTQKYYFPDNKVTFFATPQNGKLGVGLWGDPPEADNNIDLKGSASGVKPYIYVSQWNEQDPAVLWTKASALFMVALYNPNSLWISTVESAGA